MENYAGEMKLTDKLLLELNLPKFKPNHLYKYRFHQNGPVVALGSMNPHDFVSSTQKDQWKYDLQKLTIADKFRTELKS